MQLTLLAVPGCPNARVLKQRLAGLLAGRPEVTVTRRGYPMRPRRRGGVCAGHRRC